MITSVSIKNFRSIESMELSLGKINVLTGANNSGKSSVIYALLALKNAVTNPNQTVDEMLNLEFINLGGFKETVYKKDIKRGIVYSLEIMEEGYPVKYELSIGEKGTAGSNIVFEETEENKTPIAIGFNYPYTGTKTEQFKVGKFPNDVRIYWNGLIGDIIPYEDDSKEEMIRGLARLTKEQLGYSDNEKIKKSLLTPNQTVRTIDAVPLPRGFTKPVFNQVPLREEITTEEELATAISLDRDLEGLIAFYLEKIVERHFSVYKTLIPGLFHLQTRNKKTGFTADLVNEGLGTNQLVTILAKALYKNASFICIDEPEIHLHPSIIDKLVNVLIDIANERGKQFLISTHSEHFITALLTAVVKKRITPEEIKVYHLTKDGWDTKAQEQKINDEGQIEGGLGAFYAAELNDWTSFFKTEE